MTVREREAVASRLRAVVDEGLSRCPRFAEIAERWERWWAGDADRVLLAGTAPLGPAARGRKPFDLLEQPAAWLDSCRRRLDATYFVDQSVPHIRVDLGPVVPAAFVGAPLHFALAEDTSWQDPLPDLYERLPLGIDPANRWFAAYDALLTAAAADAAGNYLVSLPDLSGPTDILANLRGSEQLLMDLYDRPDDVERASRNLVDAWEHAFAHSVQRITGAGAGITTWLQAWSGAPHTTPTCDFSYMVGPDHFSRFCLPYLDEQARRAGRCLFHLDGDGASRHAAALAETPSITGVQYTPGAGSAGAVAKVPMYRMLQEAGKPVLIACEPHEVGELVRLLDRRRTVLLVDGISSLAEARELEAMV